MSNKDMTTAFTAAAEIAKKMPKNLQEAAFNRALDHLVGVSQKAASPQSPRKTRADRNARTASGAEDSHSTNLLNSINRTSYPDVGATKRVADQALKVLQLAQDDHRVDGLTAPQIADILTQKFRLLVKANAVNMALARETGMVDVRQGPGGSKTFHLMDPGEKYLKDLRKRGVEKDSSKIRREKRRTKKSARSTGGAPSVAKTESSKKRKPTIKAPKLNGKKRTGRPGPKAALAQLLGAGFFKSARTIAEIQKHLKHKKGHSYTVQELAPALVRSIRDETLNRERAESGQYEYTKA